MTIRPYIPTLLLAASLLSSPPAFSRQRPASTTFSAVLSRAVDGDTFFLTRGTHEEKARLHYGDAAEIAHNSKETDQPFGREALEYVRKNWEGKTVTVTVRGHSYDRIVVDVVAKDTGKDLALDLVRLGLAVCPKEFHPPQVLRDAQDAAQKKAVGMWNQKQVTLPADWRKQHRKSVNLKSVPVGSVYVDHGQSLARLPYDPDKNDRNILVYGRRLSDSAIVPQFQNWPVDTVSN